jgi:hypothetical protein
MKNSYDPSEHGPSGQGKVGIGCGLMSVLMILAVLCLAFALCAWQQEIRHEKLPQSCAVHR